MSEVEAAPAVVLVGWVVSSDAVVPSAGGGGGAAATPAADERAVPQLGGLGATTLRSSKRHTGHSHHCLTGF